MTTHDLTTDQPTKPSAPRGTRFVLVAASLALALVVVAPVLLSSQDLFRWAETGLGLPAGWAWLVPVALDCAAVVCVLFCVVSAWRRERPGIFAVLVWVFAGVSAWVQYVHGMTPSVRVSAPQAAYGFPALALLGPLLLEVVLGRVRRWARADAGQIMASGVSFGERWLPGVALRETLRAWAASKREGFTRPEDAIAYVREREALKDLSGTDALRYAFRAQDSFNIHSAEIYLQARGVRVTQADIDEATAGRPRAIMSVAPVSPAPAGMSTQDMHRAMLTACKTGRERISYAFESLGGYDQAAAGRFLQEYGYNPSRSEINAVAKRATGALTAESGAYPSVTATQINGHSHELVPTV